MVSEGGTHAIGGGLGRGASLLHDGQALHVSNLP